MTIIKSLNLQEYCNSLGYLNHEGINYDTTKFGELYIMKCPEKRTIIINDNSVKMDLKKDGLYYPRQLKFFSIYNMKPNGSISNEEISYVVEVLRKSEPGKTDIDITTLLNY